MRRRAASMVLMLLAAVAGLFAVVMFAKLCASAAGRDRSRAGHSDGERHPAELEISGPA